MATQEKTVLTVKASVKAPVEKVWNYWNTPAHITQWNSASEDWHSPRSENDLRAGGKFSHRMEAKDGSFGFDYAGTYDVVTPNKYLEFTLGDGRKVTVEFTANGDSTQINESFEAESTNSLELQQGGWQAILDNFKKYAENN